MLLVLSGRGYQSLGGNVYPARTGTVFLFDAMASHDQGYPPHPAPAEHLWLAFVQDRVVAVLWRLGVGKTGSVEQWRRWFSLGELGLASVSSLFPGPGEPADAARARVFAGVAFLAAALVAGGDQPPAAEATRQLRDEVMTMIQRHIREAEGKGCRLDNLARLAGYGKFHFLRLFRAYAGMTPLQYAEGCRRKAYERLVAEGYRQNAIAESMGFAHPSALTRWRKRQGLPNPSPAAG